MGNRFRDISVMVGRAFIATVTVGVVVAFEADPSMLASGLLIHAHAEHAFIRMIVTLAY